MEQNLNMEFNFPNIVIIPLEENGLTFGYCIKSEEGYTLALPQNPKYYDEEGNILEAKYCSECIVGIDYDFSAFPYVAIPKGQMRK